MPTPKVPIGPGRDAYSKRTRAILAAVLGAVIAIAVTVGIIIAVKSPSTTAKSTTIPLADRGASKELLAAAEAVGFRPNVEAGVGQFEDLPASAVSPSSNDSLIAVGTLAPEFSLRTPLGERIKLSSFRGKAVLLEFFTTWCPHCDAEAPYLEKLYASLDHSKIAFVAVNADGEDAASVLAYHIYFGMSYPVLLDPSDHPGSFRSPGAAGPVTTYYRVASYPTFYVIDTHGNIVWRGDGEQPNDLLRQELLKATGM